MIQNRCSWVSDEEVYIKYHDDEWGVPTYDDELLFEMLVLESFQAGLSWITILKKRENFKKAFDEFDVLKVSEYGEDKINELLDNKEIYLLKFKKNMEVFPTISGHLLMVK